MSARMIESCYDEMAQSRGTDLLGEVYEAIRDLLPERINREFLACRKARDEEGMEQVCWQEGFGWLYKMKLETAEVDALLPGSPRISLN